MQKILLLHGALGKEDDLYPLADKLRNLNFEPICFNFSGHGTKALSSKMTIAGFTEELSAFITTNNLGPLPVFGYSMGGYVALRLSLTQPHLFTHIITLATKLVWTPEIAAKEATACNEKFLQEKAPDFLKSLQNKHVNCGELLAATSNLLTELGAENFDPSGFAAISQALLLCLGDRDKMVSLDETLALYKKMPSAALSVIPNTKHPLESADVGLLSELLSKFCKA